MAQPRTDRRLLDAALSSAVELTLPTDPRPGAPRLGFFRMPDDSHQSVLPPIHQQLAAAVADFPAAVAREGLESRLTELDTESRNRQDENTNATLASVLRYGLLSEVNLGFLVGPILPAAALMEIARFSVRNTWVGTIAGPIRRHDAALIDDPPPGLLEAARIGFLFGPTRSIIFDPDRPVSVESFVVSRGYDKKDPPLTLRIDLRDCSVRTQASQTNGGQGAFSGVGPPVARAPSTGAFSMRGPNDSELHDWIPFFYRTLDENVPAISQELLGLTREHPEAEFLAMRLHERYERPTQGNPRETLYLETAIGELSRHRQVPRQVANPILLPDAILMPPELDHRVLEKVLLSLQDTIAEEGAESPLGRILRTHWDRISQQADQIVPAVRSSRRRLEHLVREEAGKRSHYLFHAGLSTFSPDSEAIKRSLVRQATMLHVLNSLSDLPIEVTYRLYTAPSITGELGARFEVDATVSDCDAAQAAELRESFGEIVHAAFVGAYGLNFGFSGPKQGTDEELRLQHPRFEKEIVRERGGGGGYQPFYGRPDWGYLLDYLLTLDHQVVIKLRASAGGLGEAPFALDGALEDLDERDETARSVLNTLLRRFATTSDAVSLRVSVGSNHEVSAPLLQLVGTEIAGSRAFDLADVAEVDADPIRARMSMAEGFGVFHAPYGEFFASRIGQQVTRLTSSVESFPITGIEIGTAFRAHAKADRRIHVRLPENDVLRHLYVIGRTGSGKTNFLRGLAEQHLLSPGTGLAVIDPHGDLAGHVLNSVPAARVDEVVTVDVTDPLFLPVLNPLIFDGTDAFSRSRIVQDVLELMKQRLYHEWAGPRFDEIVRLALDTMLDGGYPVAPSLTDVMRILADQDLQSALIKRLRDPELIARWKFHQRLTTSREYPELIDWVVSKFDDISRDESLRMIFGGERKTIDIDRVVRENGILIVRLPEAEIGRQAAELVGSLVLQRLRGALLQRSFPSAGAGGHFFVYVDEFQKFATTAFGELVAEARKYGVGIVLAHQNLDQLKLFSPQSGQQDQSLLSALLGNVGSMVCFGVGAPDIEVMASQLAVRQSDVSGIGRHQALARLTLDGAWVPTMTLVTELHDPELDPRRQDEIRGFQYQAQRVFPRSEILRQIEARRRVLTELGAGESPGATPPQSADRFIDDWRNKRTAALRDDSRADSPPKSRSRATKDLVTPQTDTVSKRPRRGAGPRTPPTLAAPSSWPELIGLVVRLDRVADVLGESTETLRRRAQLGRLLILTTASGTEVIPANHFLRSKPLPGLEAVLGALQQTDWSLWSRAIWLNTPLGGLGGKTIVGWLAAGLDPDMPALIAEARAADE